MRKLILLICLIMISSISFAQAIGGGIAVRGSDGNGNFPYLKTGSDGALAGKTVKIIVTNAYTLATGTVSDLATLTGVTVGQIVAIQCRTGTAYVSGTGNTAATLQAVGWKLNADDSYQTFRYGGPAASLKMCADSTAVATVSITIYTEN